MFVIIVAEADERFGTFYHNPVVVEFFQRVCDAGKEDQFTGALHPGACGGAALPNGTQNAPFLQRKRVAAEFVRFVFGLVPKIDHFPVAVGNDAGNIVGGQRIIGNVGAGSAEQDRQDGGQKQVFHGRYI